MPDISQFQNLAVGYGKRLIVVDMGKCGTARRLCMHIGFHMRLRKALFLPGFKSIIYAEFHLASILHT
jgi:hypothetical protein